MSFSAVTPKSRLLNKNIRFHEETNKIIIGQKNKSKKSNKLMN